MSARFDVIVLGCGPAGERAAIQAAKAGKHVAVIERAHVVGGNRVNWGTVPSKTLRESALFVLALTRNKLHGIRTDIAGEITVADFMYREKNVVQRELDLINESLDRYRITVFQGHGRFVDPHRVIDQPAFGGLPIPREGLGPLRVRQRRDRTHDRLPLDDREAGVREAGHAAHDDHGEHEGAAAKQPRSHGALGGIGGDVHGWSGREAAMIPPPGAGFASPRVS